jgi:dTDP-4-dehydrorhamnose 3,5-epimerase
LSIEIQNTKIEDLIILNREPLFDDRGYFERLYCIDDSKSVLKNKKIEQINHSLTKKKGAVRGLHFQSPPFSEVKMVSCIKGEVWDIAIDIRKNSPTFLRYHAEILTATNNKTLLIPEGFAHGFQTLTADCEMLYFHTKKFNKDHDSAINILDPLLNINWPIEISEISERDRSHNMLNKLFNGIII